MKEIIKIVDKMGWNDMPANVALNAVWTIMRNRHNVIAECCEEYLCEETILHDMASEELTSDILWLDLFIHDYQTLNDNTLHTMAEYLRYEVEREMKEGTLFEDARKEWDV